MGKYLLRWELNSTLIPTVAKERGNGFASLMVLVQKDIDKGLTKDWGCFVGEGRGYCVVEGSEVDISKMVQQYNPFCKFSSHPIASVDQMNEVFKSMVD